MKVCIICFDFIRSNVPLQPWRYIYEISNRMVRKGVDVEIISNNQLSTQHSDEINGIKITYSNQFKIFSRKKDLMRLIEQKAPDILMLSMGPTSISFIPILRSCKLPVIGLWMGTIYNLEYIFNLGIDELSRNYSSLYLHIISSIIPSSLMRYFFKSDAIRKLIVLNKNSRKILTDYGFPANKVSVIPPGITIEDLILPEKEVVVKLREGLAIGKESFVVLYLGSALTLRGTDTLIEAISIIREKIPSIKLIILSRSSLRDDLSSGVDHLSKEESYIKDLCKLKNVDKSSMIISGFLDKEDLKKYILLSDVVALPFKLVQSDTPISILEVMALGKPIISTKVDGIPELLEGDRGFLVNPNDPNDLARAINSLHKDNALRNKIGENAREYMLSYPDWDKITDCAINEIREVMN